MRFYSTWFPFPHTDCNTDADSDSYRIPISNAGVFRIRIHNVCNIIIAVIILWLSTPAAAAVAAGGKWLFIMHAARVPTL